MCMHLKLKFWILLFQVLDGLCDDTCRLSVCKALLDKSQLDFTSQLFVLHYVILKLSSFLEKPEMEKYANHALGIKVDVPHGKI